MLDRVAIIARLLSHVGVRETADIDRLHRTLAEHYPGLTLDEVRQAVAHALEDRADV